MSDVHVGRPLTDAIVDVLELAGLRPGRGQQPPGSGWQGEEGKSQFLPYVLVHPVGGGTTRGTVGLPYVFGFPIYLLTSVGADQRQCQEHADQVRLTILAADLVHGDRTVVLVLDDDLGGVTIDDTVRPSVYMAPARFRFRTST